jgi:hypothetical protein
MKIREIEMKWRKLRQKEKNEKMTYLEHHSAPDARPDKA